MSDTLTVRLGERSYPIHFGADLTAEVRAAVAQLEREGRRVAVLTDRNVAACQAAALQAMFGGAPMLVTGAGESVKTLAELERVLDFLAENRLDRAGVLVAAGGGVIGDLGGFAAAAWLRGIDFWQVPTTLLAMVDSSVGGKTGVNLKAGKNLAGAFHQPRAVFIATGLLATLPPREFAAGMAEVIKYGLLGDAALFAQLEREPLTVTSPALAAVVRRCCEIKAAVVESDERELAREGGRALLNLGHTFGHAIEQVAGYGAYLHGEAVAVGLAAAARLSAGLGLPAGADAVKGEGETAAGDAGSAAGAAGAGEIARVERVLAAHALPARLRAALPLGALLAAMARDKKVRAGAPRFVVLKSLGESATQPGVDPALVESVWRELGAT
jgi:3-dehydroquinate synthase